MSQKRYDTNVDKKEILKGLEFFESSEDPNFINPQEIKDLMDKLELRDKMGFIYDLIDKLCSNREVRRNGGLTKDEFMKYLEEKMNDTESKEGIHTFYDVFTDSKDETLPMTNFCRTAREINDYKKDQELKELLENADMTGKELDFDEFYEIMKSDGNSKKNEKKYQPGNTYSNKYSRKNYDRKDDEEEPKEERSYGRYGYKNKKPSENNNSSLEKETRNPYSYKRVKVEQTKNSKYERPKPEEKHVEKEVIIENEGTPSKYGRSKDGNYVRVVKKTEISEEPNNNRNERLEKRIVVEEIVTTEKTVEVPSYNPRYKYKNNKGNQDDKKDETKHYSYKVNRQTYTKESQNEDNNDGSDSKRYHRRYRASNRSNDKSNENNNNNGNTTYSRYRRKV